MRDSTIRKGQQSFASPNWEELNTKSKKEFKIPPFIVCMQSIVEMNRIVGLLYIPDIRIHICKLGTLDHIVHT